MNLEKLQKKQKKTQDNVSETQYTEPAICLLTQTTASSRD